MNARAVMVLGTTSGAGKSWLTTALCRWYARQGLKVAPFKAQNMSNNARVVPGLEGQLGEIGSAQYFQALAAGITPDVRMNPVLLKPEKDTASQVVVMGQVRPDYSRMPWRSRSEVLWPHARQALHSLMADHDVVVIEGAGSPAEINLHDNDFVNMRTALAAQARCLLVTDIDRGGAFAHLFGTWQLLPAHERALIQGFVLNRFRGDASLLAPGPQQLQAMTGVPTVAVLPMWRGHGLPEEDGVFDDAPTGPASGEAATLRIAVVAYPRISNLDEFQPLRGMPHVRLSWVRHPSQLADVDGVILPGSKHTVSDLAWLRETGLAAAIQAHAGAGRWVLGICGGLQMLGRSVADPHGVEADAGTEVAGLGLLDVHTRYGLDKQLRQTQASFATPQALRTEGPVPAPWSGWADVRVQGYEIRHGRTEATSPHAVPALIDAQGHCLGWRQGPVMGLYLHGLFEAPPLMQAWFGAQARGLPQVMDGLADFVDRHFESGTLAKLIDRPTP
ncbi:MAG: cobyric acid synthase [Aquabacterium sp.]